MENWILVGLLLIPCVLFVWGGLALNKRAKKRGEQPCCACLLCFLVAGILGLLVLKRLLEAVPLELCGLVFGCTGGTLLYRDIRFFKRAIIVSGVVTGWRTLQEERWRRFSAQDALMEKKLPEQCPKNFGEGKPLYVPVVAFEFDGQSRQVTGTMGSSLKPKIGSVMKVGIDSQNINNARVFQRSSRALAWGLLAVGVGILYCAVYARLAGNY